MHTINILTKVVQIESAFDQEIHMYIRGVPRGDFHHYFHDMVK